MKNKKAKIAVRVLAVVLAAGVVVGAVFAVRTAQGGNSAVNVYQLSNMTYTSEDMGGGSEMSGTVSADQVQTVYVSDTQTVTEVFVQEGQQVKAGDPLMSYDTTLTDIEVTRKDLEIQKQKIELENLQKQVKTGRRLSAVPEEQTEPTAPTEPVEPTAPTEQTEPTAPTEPVEPTTPTEPTEPTAPTEPVEPTAPTEPTEPTAPTEPVEPTEPTEPTAPTEPVEPTAPTAPTEPTEPTEPTAPTEPDPNGSIVIDDVVNNYYVVQGEGTEKSPKFVILAENFEISDTLLNALELKDGKNYLIFVSTEGNKVSGEILSKNGMVFTKKSDGSYGFSFFDASAFTYKPANADPGIVNPGMGGGGGYYDDSKLTAAEIAEMKKKIKETDLSIRMAENELAQMKRELDNGQVLAAVDGRVSTLQDADQSRADGTPMIKVTGTGGYKIQCTIGELSRDSLQIGEEVQVMSYESGGMYTGTVDVIGDMPVTNQGYYYGQSSNTSYYPFTVVVSADADLSDNEWVSVKRNNTSVSGGSGFYLDNMFILTEGSKSYVYVRGENDKLEKRQVKTGTISYGSTEILSGLNRDTEWIAFPYGKTVKEGASTREATMDELYS